MWLIWQIYYWDLFHPSYMALLKCMTCILWKLSLNMCNPICKTEHNSTVCIKHRKTIGKYVFHKSIKCFFLSKQGTNGHNLGTSLFAHTKGLRFYCNPPKEMWNMTWCPSSRAQSIFFILVCSLLTIMILVNSRVPLQKKEWPQTLFLQGATPIN